MMTRSIQLSPITRCLLLACIVTFAAVLLLPARADAQPTLPTAPPNLEVPTGHKLFLVGHASGTQQYMCLFNGSDFAWSFFGPQATLLNEGDRQISTHYLSPNPAEAGAPRATWQHMRDGSIVWAVPIAASTDPTYVAPGAIPWLLLEVKGAESGHHGSGKLTRTTFIQRLNTTGGVAPATGCNEQSDIGKKALVPYTSVYFFYKAADAA